MVKNIIKSENIFSFFQEPATKSDLYIVDDLIDTLKFNLNGCVGMSASMIGYNKRIIVFVDELNNINYMINPVILNKSNEYLTNEGCLSLDGNRSIKRFKRIKVEYYNDKFQKRIKTFNDFTAEIIQHEIDHLNGIII